MVAKKRKITSKKLGIKGKAAKKPAKPGVKKAPKKLLPADIWLRDKAIDALEAAKAEDILSVDVRENSSIADFMVIATGRSSRQVKALAEHVAKALEASGMGHVRIEGLESADWAVVDGGDVIVHILRPEVRAYYRLEEIWGLEPPLQKTFQEL
jgi:ribosome-associated protein